MCLKMSQGFLTTGVLVMIFLVVVEKTSAQAFLLTYSDEKIGSKIAQRTIEIGNNTNITEVYTVTSSSKVPSELSQTTMDAITVVWYVSTFMALMAFFFLMACSDRRCGHQQATQTSNNQQQDQPPPTPAPSYSEFAPPSYETVMKKNLPSVFVVQVPYVETEKDKDAPPPPFTFHTVNELQKITS